MKENDWLTSTDPRVMLLFIRGRSDRKRRLFACACCRRIWRLLKSEEHRMAVEVAERFADGLATEEERSAVAYLVEGDEDDEVSESPKRLARVAASWSIQSDQESEDNFDVDEDCAILTAQCAAEASRHPAPEAAAQCHLLRDIFGNPFRPISIDPVCLSARDGAVFNLAQQIDKDQTFDALPILANLLEEGGCSDAEILEHCRKEKGHVRGCWVVDLILGKG